MNRVALLILAIGLTGCASGLTAAVPTAPGRDQSHLQATTDEHECEKQARTQPNREFAYQACMIARSYWTTVGVGASAFVEVYGTPRAYDIARTDLGSCLGAAPKVGGGTVALGILFGYGAMSGVALEAQQSVMRCMIAKGYEARAWRGRQ